MTKAAGTLSPMAARLLRRGQQALQSGDGAAALQAFTGALGLAPENAEVARWTGIAAQNLGDHARAAACFRRALAALPDDADLRIGLGVALYRLGRDDEGLEHLRRACELAPGSASAWYNLAEALKPHARTEEAIAALQRALAIDPAHMQARLGLSRAQASLGRIDEAAAGLREVLRHRPADAEAWSALADLKIVAFDAQDVRALEAALSDTGLAPDARSRLAFVLARALEDQGDYARAFDLLQRANAAQRQRVAWDAAGERARVESILPVFAQPVARAPADTLGREGIFVASLPRSGSTLVEQILASHPEVEGAGEIGDLAALLDAETRCRARYFPAWVPDATAGDWRRLGEAYLARTACWRARAPRLVDKNLLNWMLVGAILSMLPGAHVVVVRRDPVETCLACYRQWFAQDAGFSFDLDEMADFYAGFWRLTRFWLDRFPGQVFDLEYETLVDEPEPAIRRLLDFCDLPFDPACLAFHRTERTVLSAPSAAQVRQPLRRDTARAQHYGDRLDGLRARLRAAGVPFREG